MRVLNYAGSEVNLACPSCKNEHLEIKNVYYEDNGFPCEYEVHCEGCGIQTHYYAYGDIENIETEKAVGGYEKPDVKFLIKLMLALIIPSFLTFLVLNRIRKKGSFK